MLSHKVSRDSGRKSSLSFLALIKKHVLRVIRCSCLEKEKLHTSACSRLVNYLNMVFPHLESYTSERNFILTKTEENGVQAQKTGHEVSFYNH